MYTKFLFSSVIFVLVICVVKCDVMPPERTHLAVVGKNVIIKCTSNLDDDHIFMYWHIPKFNVVIGPRNRFNHVKYNYDAISGNLEIRGVTSSDQGIYTCVSEGVEIQDIEIRNVKLEIIDPLPYSDKLPEIEREEREQYIWTAIIIFLVTLTVVIIIYLGVFTQQQIRIRCRQTNFDIESGCSSGVYNTTTTSPSNSNQSTPNENQKLCRKSSSADKQQIKREEEEENDEKPEESKMLKPASPVIDV